MTAKQTFGAWLLQQGKRRGIIGDYARDTIDSEYKVVTGSLKEVEEFMYKVNWSPCKQATRALKRLYKEWEAL